MSNNSDFKKFTGLTDEQISSIKKFISNDYKAPEDNKKYTSSGFWTVRPLRTDKRNGTEIFSPDIIKQKCPKEPSKLPESLTWCTLDSKNMQDMTELSLFLNKHYMYEPGENMALVYSPEFLSWYLSTPNSEGHNNLCIGIKTQNKLVASITGVFFNGAFFNNELKLMDVDFLCIHPKIRKKGFAKKLIDEVVRQKINKNVFHGTFSGNTELNKQICDLKFYHRPINVKKLIKSNFLEVDNPDIEASEKMFQINDELDENFVKFTDEYTDEVHNLLNTYLNDFPVHFTFTKEQIKYLFINPHVNSYVYLQDGKVTDFISITKTDYKVYKPKNISNIKIGTIFYYAPMNNTLYTLGKNLIIASKKEGIDVINCLDDMDNHKLINNLKFTQGTGTLKHYLYNWVGAHTEPTDIAKHVM